MLIGRRNLSKEDRDELIRRLAASGRHTQKEIAETVGLTRSAVTKIVGEVKNSHSPSIKSTSAAEELEAKQREIAAKMAAVHRQYVSSVRGDIEKELLGDVRIGQPPTIPTKSKQTSGDEAEKLKRG